MKKRIKILNFLISFTIIFLNLSTNIFANEINGVANITDGDTIKILNNRIRFHGIDAPENSQNCLIKSKKYSCGKIASAALSKKISKNIVKCKVQDKKDRYKRYIGVCYIKKINLNKWMVRNGYAVAYRKYSKDYINDEEYAKKHKLGLWAGNFMSPEKWRKLN